MADSTDYVLQSFLYDEDNQEQRTARSNLYDVMILYHTDEERLAFETHLEENQNLVERAVSEAKSEYTYVDTGNLHKTQQYINRLQKAVGLNKLFELYKRNK